MANQLQNKTESQPWSDEDLRDLHRSGLSRHLVSTYGWKSRIARTAALKLAARFERGHLYSFTLREILNRYYGVHVGAYSYGACLVPGTIPPGVTIGRYCSIAHGLRAFVRDHPYDWLSMHPFFYNKECGIVAQDTLAPGTLEIGHDTWIGANVVITPNCDRIGLGAVVGAGAIVTKNVPDFAIVAGNPAKVLRQRFSDELCETIRQSRWWNLPISACKKFVSEMTRPLHELGQEHPLLHCNTPSPEIGSTLSLHEERTD